MSPRFWRVFFIAVLSVALVRTASAESIQAAGKQITIGIVVVSIAIGIGVTLLILHEKHKKAVLTGCVASATNGMSITDAKDGRTYALTGDPTGIKPGDRMTLEGKRRGSANTVVFEAHRVIRDLGACQR